MGGLVLVNGYEQMLVLGEAVWRPATRFPG